MLKYIYLFFFLSSFYSTNAQENIFYNHKKLSISNGLSHNGVTSILEDSKGFMWFGTYSGINRYDGYKIKTYKNTNKKVILSSNRVRSLAEDKNGTIWIGTDRGVTVYQSASQKFIKLKNVVENSYREKVVKKIIISKSDHLIYAVLENKGIQIFSDDYQYLGEYSINRALNINETIKVNDAIQLNKSYILIATNIGLLTFNLKTKQYQHHLKKQLRVTYSLLKIDDENLLAANYSGIHLLSIDTFGELISFTNKKTYLKEARFTKMNMDTEGSLWLGTQRSGLIYIKNTDAFFKGNTYKIEKFNTAKSVLTSSDILATSQNSCWYATFNSGVYKFNTKENVFVKCNMGKKENKVYNIEEIDSSKIFVSRGFNDVAIYNLATRDFKNLPLKELKNSDYIYKDSKGDYWVNSRKDNFFRLSSKTLEKEIIKLNEEDASKGIYKIRCITEETNQIRKIWIGSFGGLYRITIDENNNILKSESLNNHLFFTKKKISGIRGIYPDPINNFMWVATDHKGLYRIKKRNAISLQNVEVEQFIPNEDDEFSLPSYFVTAVLRLPNNQLWIGTEGGGVCRIDNSEGYPKFIPFTEENGLSNNVVKSILNHGDSNLWAATNIGLNKINTNTLKVTKYGKSDGLPFEDFYYGSKKLKNGNFVLTGQKGLCYFNPKDVLEKESIPKIEFENFKIFNKEISVGDTIANRVIFPISIGQIKEINLKHNENVFSLDIVSLHYSNPENHLIKYKLKPINKEWVEVASDKNTITYSGLQPGEYQLNVATSNSLGEWGTPKIIKITIHPPIWKTPWAYGIYVMLLIAIGYLINRTVLKIYILNHKIEIEQLEKDNEKDVNEAKLRFFANISHEIKTPLTLISSPIHNLYERFKGNPDIGEKLSIVLRQSKKIHELLEQVQDFRRSDANMLKMTYERFEFNSFINEVVNDFMYIAYSDKKELKLIVDESPIIVSADKNKLEKIVNNLLNNAFKYTSQNDQIKVSYHCDEKDLILTFEDSGRGIDPIDLAHVFERFYQSHLPNNEHIGGSGIGLAFSKRLVEMHYGYINVESELGKGSKFIVKLPIVKEQEEGDVLLTEEIVLPKEKEVSVQNIMNNEEWSKIEVSPEFKDSLVFYAEDNDEMRNYITRFLSQFFKVKSFRNGKECYDAFDEEWPDLVISDVQMPEMNGLDLCIKIKSDLKTSHIPIVLLTALTNLTDHLQGIRDGADAYIKKPFNLEQLTTTLQALLNNRKQLRERFKIGIPLTKDNKNSRNDNAFLEKFYSVIDENLDNKDFDLKDLASDLCLSKSAFYQKVKTLTNQTPLELIINYRLKRASELLTQEKLSVTEVFFMTGFKSRTHFSTKFKEKYNVSPSKYAQKVEEENKLS
ncbi:hybrid sensor histidine kinase/response regulator transcription factor [Wenyingzhuangia aestuarii]|uniref:hybrid sensor histidine kinase/response regulator transcription factor n=1 Tax=Wenyingzhuangia aestuarii TaxID=1647582 RepID=UPI00143C4FC0|nr:hybrid sensor histidine kinase/response regulator transcription factor [Wenyingzhuangia aestuarii]NJB83680.1 signal transduction histidine kinase/DNA-binding response OmpR family regulator/ligand-binding sensor domain-containing protein [Wenyingzhuangia aestuarii]